MKNLNAEFLLYTGEIRTHEMKLHPAPFEAIKEGCKNVEMRLNDERRQLIRCGDYIRFANVKTGEELFAKVVGREVYPSFYELYSRHDKLSIGYKENEVEPLGHA